MMFGRVLRGNDDKWQRQRPRDALDRDLLLGHRLEQCRLGLWRGTIDLVREYDIRKYRPRFPLKIPTPLVEDRKSDHIGRQQIGGELDTLKRQLKSTSQRICERRFSN